MPLFPVREPKAEKKTGGASALDLLSKLLSSNDKPANARALLPASVVGGLIRQLNLIAGTVVYAGAQLSIKQWLKIAVVLRIITPNLLPSGAAVLQAVTKAVMSMLRVGTALLVKKGRTVAQFVLLGLLRIVTGRAI